MIGCQSTGCAPMVAAFESGERFASPPGAPATVAAGLRVPSAVGDFMILDAVRASGGALRSAEEGRIREWMGLACSLEGLSLCPETAVCLGVLQQAVAEGAIGADESVVVFNTGAAQKYVELLSTEMVRLDFEHPDWATIESLA